MKYLVFLSMFLFCSSNLISQENKREFLYTEGDTTYVMKRYIFGLLMSGPNRNQDSATVAELQKGHLAHLNKMAENGKLVVAGPFENGGDYRGLLIFDVATKEEAFELESNDPAVKAGRLKLIVIPWWGAKGTYLP